MKIKVKIEDTPNGVVYSKFQKGFWGWNFVGGFKPLSSCFFLISDDIDQLNKMFGSENIILQNNSVIYKLGQR